MVVVDEVRPVRRPVVEPPGPGRARQPLLERPAGGDAQAGLRPVGRRRGSGRDVVGGVGGGRDRGGHEGEHGRSDRAGEQARHAASRVRARGDGRAQHAHLGPVRSITPREALRIGTLKRSASDWRGPIQTPHERPR
ncbi:hypothetical protein J2S63_000354 [Marmoricola bigeumensis]|uniref:Uncharacterized protein n=1 Tax=Nocardioides marmoribigeumensis TaxID=433649 RepID=A0ABU2BR97_9ACTN|nr:hypothetical protein [Nocardioides marmoribigeumensis]